VSTQTAADVEALTGEFVWTPTADDALTTNEFVIALHDDILASPSDQSTLRVVVVDHLQITGFEIESEMQRPTWNSYSGAMYKVHTTSNLAGSVEWVSRTNCIEAAGFEASNLVAVTGEVEMIRIENIPVPR
jgi:hypothetical protein